VFDQDSLPPSDCSICSICSLAACKRNAIRLDPRRGAIGRAMTLRACLYPAHSGGRLCDGQDARFSGAERDMAWIEVASRGEVPAGGMLEVEAGGRALLLYDLNGTVFATSAICPHHAAFLSQGHVSGESIECPRHMGRFHIPSIRQERGPLPRSAHLQGEGRKLESYWARKHLAPVLRRSDS
jgi:3-phenylpropionate/trans-cinnamate dioxygenase ferredoxin component